ncbi:Glycosyl hydrolases family 43 [Paenibacillus sp. UNCCL117]|uniref:family 43 glycosylhydrolase n=1 Tax=unclassified Paenibacillus TaxID=185978 RepID=UPI0008809BD9|nr:MULTISPECIES: family 43 glycosylhydrolase [unclassified Paenibacillus]SDE07495.1 Glycosyl hydrolases family 43 [Paenibacillus sp. cl123]SFW59160.1 Glycosyl hydrolases family 43 [Paenibacillus sp. UNCCL117]
MQNTGLLSWRRSIPFMVCLMLLFGGSSAFAAEQVIVNANQWNDTAGNPIQAHAGGVIKEGSYYYWFGVERNADVGMTFKQLNMYRSADLKNWEYVNAILTENSHPDLNWCKIERPKIIYNDTTGQYVMWMHYEEGDNYNLAQAAVAVSSTIDGDYTFISRGRPLNTHMSRDATLFKDDDGTGYFISAARGNADLNIYRLSADYLSIDSLTATLWPGNYREAPAMVKRNGYYYLLTSGATGWSYNQAKYAYSTNISSGWSSLFNIGSPSTYESQGNYILPVAGTGETSYLYMTDRHAGAFGEHFNYGKYVWHELQFNSNTDVTMSWYPKLSIDAQTGDIHKVNQNTDTGTVLKKDFGPDTTYLSMSNNEEFPYMSTVISAESTWIKEDVDGTYFRLKHKRTGKYLHNNTAAGNKVNLIDPQWQGDNVQWKLVDAGGGYSRLVHKSSGLWLRAFPYGAGLGLVDTTNTDNKTKWLVQ